LLVVTHHCGCAFADWLRFPAVSLDERPYLLQLPYFRLLVNGGNFFVANFFLLSGFVCSMKSLRLARAGEEVTVRDVISDSMFRRTVRLIVPATIATIISWTICQLGGYNMAHRYGNWWVGDVASSVPGFMLPVESLLRNCVQSTFESQLICS
jgi:peptidoglycan/LPS O-acetylase OafA/YrhL